MFKLTLRGEDGEYINLDSMGKDYGYQALSGLTGMGMPSVSNQWFEGAGDGALHRGRRFLPRDLDIPLTIWAKSHDQLMWLIRRLSKSLSGTVYVYLTMVNADGSDGDLWRLDTVYEGGMDFTYGEDTIGTTWANTVLTLRAGYPFWSKRQGLPVQTLSDASGTNATKTISANMSFYNDSDADSPVTWTVQGPATRVELRSPRWRRIVIDNPIPEGKVLTINTAEGTVRDQNGVNNYGYLAPAPSFWKMEPGDNNYWVEIRGGSTGRAEPNSVSRVNFVPNPRMLPDGPLYTYKALSRPNLAGNGTLFNAQDTYSRAGVIVDPAANNLHGRTMNASARARRESGEFTAAMHVMFSFPDGSLRQLEGDWQELPSSGKWVRLDKTFTVPTDAVRIYCSVVVRSPDTFSAGEFEVGQNILERGYSYKGYFDGSSYSGSNNLDKDGNLYSWAGTPHRSISRIQSTSIVGASAVSCEVNVLRSMIV